MHAIEDEGLCVASMGTELVACGRSYFSSLGALPPRRTTISNIITY